MTKIMTGLLYRKLNLDLLDWDGYVLIRSISYAKDSDMYAVVEENNLQEIREVCNYKTTDSNSRRNDDNIRKKPTIAPIIIPRHS